MKQFTSILLKAGIAFGLPLGLCMFAMTAWMNIYVALALAVVVAVGGGSVFGIGMAVFVTSRTVREQTRIVLAEGEHVIHTGGASHFVGLEGVGGRLYLTNLRLHFKSHSFNIQTHELSIPLKEIAEAETTMTFGVIPNGLLVLTCDGRRERFGVHGRKKWVEKIMSTIS